MTLCLSLYSFIVRKFRFPLKQKEKLHQLILIREVPALHHRIIPLRAYEAKTKNYCLSGNSKNLIFLKDILTNHVSET